MNQFDFGILKKIIGTEPPSDILALITDSKIRDYAPEGGLDDIDLAHFVFLCIAAIAESKPQATVEDVTIKSVALALLRTAFPDNNDLSDEIEFALSPRNKLLSRHGGNFSLSERGERGRRQ